MPGLNPGSPSWSGFNQSFDGSLVYDATAGGLDCGFGANWLCPGLAGLGGVGGGSPATGRVTYNQGPGQVKGFVPGATSGSYRAEYSSKTQLEWNGSGYKMLSPLGGAKNFDSSGKPLSFADRGNNAATFTYSGSEINEVGISSGGESLKAEFHWSTLGGVRRITTAYVVVNGRKSRKTEYAYSGTQLVTIKDYVNSAASGDPDDWGSDPVSAWLFTYHTTGSPLLHHVVTPVKYRQMVNNGITPESATTAQLNDYAASEYLYTGGRVSTLYTNGQEYMYGFAYVPSGHAVSSLDVWTMKTEVTSPDGSTRTYYFNRAQQLLFEKVVDASAKTWNVIGQRFHASGAVAWQYDAASINVFSESNPSLFTVKTNAGKITRYVYNASGYLDNVALLNGSAGTPVKQRSYSYTTQSAGGMTIVLPSGETVYRDDAGTQPITTSIGYTSFYSGTFQPTQVVTTLPVVGTSENGPGGTAKTRVANYDSRGYLTSSVDERGTVTGYTYDKPRGGVKQVVRDQGSGKLNLTTDYTLDDEGRRILELGPLHEVDLGGGVVDIRTARWTYYLDHEGRTVSFGGYHAPTTSSNQIVGPVTVSEPNLAPPGGSGGSYPGWRQSSTYDAVWASAGIPLPADTYLQADWVRWTIALSDEFGRKKEEWSYFDIPVPVIPTDIEFGAQSTNYGKKLFAYDSGGRLNQTTCAGGTIDKTTFNAMGWAVAEELGTSAGLVEVELKDYDGDGNLTKRTLPVDSHPHNPANDRVTDFRYDWRNRLEETETNVQDGNGGSWTLITKNAYDNRSLVVSVTGYHTSVATGNRTSYQTMEHDVLGRRYRTLVYGVNDATGNTSNPQTSNTYYEPGGQVAREAPSGSALFTATQYDAVGRPLKTFNAYEPSGYSTGSDPASMANAVVMEQQEFDWDKASNLLSTVTRLRFDTAPDTDLGELADPNNAPEARCSFVASYPDALGRVIATADYGAEASASWMRSATVPTRSDNILVISSVYDAAGNITEFADPDDVKTTREYDNADRVITLTENAAGSVPAKRVTRYEYTDDGWLRKMKCDNNAASGQQVTEWVYGVTNGGGSDLNSNRLVLKKYYPNTSGGSDYEYFGYNRQQQVTAKGDQNGTLRILQYDRLGRLVYDSAVTVGSGVDNSVIGLATGYNRRGLVSRLLSIAPSPATVPVNDVLREYNDFNQLVTEYQEHSGYVNTSTSPKVQYTYASGSANTVRATGIIYPNGNTIATDYNSAQAGFLSRPDRITESGSPLASMRYLGLGTQIGLKYDAASNTELTYENGGTSPAPASDKYTGLDRFGRLVQTIWKNGGGSVVQSSYGRNRVGGVIWRKDEKAHSITPTPVTTQDNFYWYDGLHQVTRHDRGDLTPNTGPPYTGIDATTRQQEEDLTYDQMGNWAGYQSTSPSLVQTRPHNKDNEIINPITNPSGVAGVAYDNNGNMTSMPAPADWTDGYDCKWDVWNRLVEVKLSASPFTVVASHVYDAAYRRTTVTTAGPTVRHFYYDKRWRAVEERVSGSAVTQYTWSPIDRWTLIRRKRSNGGTLNEVLFCLRDYLDPVAVVNASGVVQERYGYDAFGTARIMDSGFTTIGSSTVAWNWLFHGEFQDPETLLYNYGYRYYHTQVGRWISRDPLGEEGGLNLYAFVHNGPTAKWDLFGLADSAVDKAAAKAVEEALKESEKDRKEKGVPAPEYCGLICCHKTTGELRKTGPFPGKWVIKDKKAECAEHQDQGCLKLGTDWIAVAGYHTHPDMRFENFSPQDLGMVDRRKMPDYLGIPGMLYVLKYSPDPKYDPKKPQNLRGGQTDPAINGGQGAREALNFDGSTHNFPTE